MNDTIPLRTRPMTAEEALARLRGWVEPWKPSDLTTNTPVHDLAEMVTDDLAFWSPRSQVRELGRLLEFAFSIRLADWESCWLPPARRMVGELCELIAASADVVEPGPVTVLGRPCLTAGTFLALRTLLARAGAEADRIGPSTPFRPYLDDGGSPLAAALFQIAPGLWNDLVWPTPLVVRAGLGSMVAGAVAFVLSLVGLGWLWAGKCGIGFAVWMWRQEPKVIRHPDVGPLVTFRDLTRAVLYHRNVTLSSLGTAP